MEKRLSRVLSGTEIPEVERRGLAGRVTEHDDHSAWSDALDGARQRGPADRFQNELESVLCFMVRVRSPSVLQSWRAPLGRAPKQSSAYA